MQTGAFRPVATGQDKLDVPFIAFVHFALIVVAIGQGQHGREQFKDIRSGMKVIMLTGCPKQAGGPRGHGTECGRPRRQAPWPGRTESERGRSTGR